MPWPTDPRRQLLLTFLICLASYLSALSYYSFELTSDDALYFSRAIERFSVLEFRPHFPGYPGFVWLEQILFYFTQSPVSNVILTFLSTALIALGVYRYTERRTSHLGSALIAALLFFSQSNLAELSLNGLSDLPALLFFIFYLLSRDSARPLLPGLSLGFCLAIRPSYLPLVTAALLIDYFMPRQRDNKIDRKHNRQKLQQLVIIAIIGAFCAVYIYAFDGFAYLAEAKRFTQGHFTIWGNTSALSGDQFSQWLQTAISSYTLPGFLLNLLVLICGLFFSKTRFLNLLCIFWIVWIIKGQNPDNVRHLAVLTLLLPIIYALLLDKLITHSRAVPAYSLALIIVSIFTCHTVTQFNLIKHSPVQQTIQFFQPFETEQIIVSNHSLALLRDKLPQHIIVDRYYEGSSQNMLNKSMAWQLTSNPLPDKNPQHTFVKRFQGEKTLYLYRSTNLPL